MCIYNKPLVGKDHRVVSGGWLGARQDPRYEKKTSIHQFSSHRWTWKLTSTRRSPLPLPWSWIRFHACWNLVRCQWNSFSARISSARRLRFSNQKGKCQSNSLWSSSLENRRSHIESEREKERENDSGDDAAIFSSLLLSASMSGGYESLLSLSSCLI